METDCHSLIKKFLSITTTFGMVVLFSCINNPDDVRAVKQNKELPVEWADDIEIIYSESGKKSVVMTAPRMEKYVNDRETYTVMPDGVHSIFFDEEIKESSSIKAGYAVEYPMKKMVEVRHNVRVINETGDTLNTEHLVWDRNRQIISTDAAVRIVTHENEVIYGENGMEADERFTRWRIKTVKESSLIIKEDED